MIKIATIRENDEQTGGLISVGYIPYIDDNGNPGYRVIASNGDDVGYYKAQSVGKCIDDIRAMWGNWDTYRLLQCPITCQKCGYTWTPRKAAPKCCPSCKQYRYHEPLAINRKEGEK